MLFASTSSSCISSLCFLLELLCFLFSFFLLFQSGLLLCHPSTLLNESLLLQSFLHTFTFSVNTTTFVTKLELAFTCHVITSFIFLDPKLTFWTLFKLFPLDEIQKFFVIIWNRGWNFVFCAGHVFVPLAPTI